ncbi:Predicted membrane protein [Ceraceosorus bombacis]|uniref:Predicted membrane protein n=1 Tax=Ceraceosorus bombacis TaxID=401625 RepID=A0A0N7L9E8_9BASI|nr:Predicted membrane protein [Ceraceosorus bombacis]
MALSSNPKDLVNLRKQLAFYGAYHTNPVNVAIHIVGVPTIIFGTECLLAAIGPLQAPEWAKPLLDSLSDAAPDIVSKYARLNWPALFAVSYWLYYTLLDYVAAILLLPIWAGLYFAVQYVALDHPADLVKVGSIASAIGWISQFYGHGVHEGRAPALLDNLLGAVVLAPFFVWLEVIFHLGYRPQLQKQLNNDIGKLVLEFRKGSKKASKEVAKGKAA